MVQNEAVWNWAEGAEEVLDGLVVFRVAYLLSFRIQCVTCTNLGFLSRV